MMTLSIVTLSIITMAGYAECHRCDPYDECHYIKFYYAECRGAPCHLVETEKFPFMKKSLSKNDK